MADSESFYSGSQYPFERPYAGFSTSGAYHQSVKDIAFPSDPLSANQLKKVSDKISSGAQTIEVSGLGLMGGGPMKHLASIPRQHWKEIDRLRKLTGVDLTFHGPLVESTGFNGRDNWTEDHRREAETQMKAAVELAQQMNSDDKKKGIVMTFHTSNGLPAVKQTIKNKDGSEQIVKYGVINERTGEVGYIPLLEEHFEKGKGTPFSTKQQVDGWLKTKNEERWENQMSNLNLEVYRAQEGINHAFASSRIIEKDTVKNIKELQEDGLQIYNNFLKNPLAAEKIIEERLKKFPNMSKEEVMFSIQSTVNDLSYADSFTNQAYIGFKEAYNEAYQKTTDKSTKEKLDKLRERIGPLVEAYKDDKTKLVEFHNELTRGIQELRSIKAPAHYIPLEKFAVDKGSETFSNVAIHAYKNAKKEGLAPGIVSIENPPVGMSGLTRAEEIKNLIVASQKKFKDKAMMPASQGGLGMSESEADKTAKQMIGATWDVGHINSMRKWGYTKKDVLNEARTIAPYVKHMHLADNLGFEDAELPIGMGNVPVDEILNADWGENFRKAKKAIETGDWYSRQGGLGMTHTPLREAFSGLTSPVYSMGDAPAPAYWNEAVVDNHGGYFGGLGDINPPIHHSIYGAGFSNLPSALGAELPGRASNSSFSGAPLE